MDVWERLKGYLPTPWTEALAMLPPAEKCRVQELRLRKGQPLRLSLPKGEYYLHSHGMTAVRQPGVLCCSPRQLEECFMRLCQESLYAHQAELEQGFLAVSGGIRVGVGGLVKTDGVKVNALRDIYSLCIRLPREHRGCAAELLPVIQVGNRLHNTLLVGEPASGKTSLLRDAAVGLSARGIRVAVVDERGELSGVNGLRGCDVLCGCPKAVGLRQAIRCLSPQVVVFDELGDEQEVREVMAAAHAGVAVVCSLHGSCPEELARLPLTGELLQRQVFARWVFLKGRGKPCSFTDVLSPEVREHEIFWHSVGGDSRRRSGYVLCAPLVPSG